jgi:nucleolar complex protein 3
MGGMTLIIRVLSKTSVTFDIACYVLSPLLSFCLVRVSSILTDALSRLYLTLRPKGETLDIDLSDFISSLYAIISPLTLMPDIESPFPTPFEFGDTRESVADILFRALTLIFSPARSGTTWRSAAFAKRLLTASVHWPPSTAMRALQFVGGLIAQQPKLEALLFSEDRSCDGVYRPDINDPQLCNALGASFWELYVLHKHCDLRVREEASRLVNFSRT